MQNALIATVLLVTVLAAAAEPGIVDDEYARNVHVPDRSFLSNEMKAATTESKKKYREVLHDDSLWPAFRKKGDTGSDGEVIDAMEYFFWGATDGIVLEMGAYNGILHSQSLGFEKNFGWGRILIEGNPHIGSVLRTKNADSVTVNCAICNETKMVHWYGNHEGIIEMFPISILEKWHLHIKEKLVRNGATVNQRLQAMDTKNVRWSSPDLAPHFKEVLCIPLHTVFSRLAVKHINFFILDVEGGELSVLHTIDWGAVLVDVFVIETEQQRRPKGYKAAISEFLRPKGYKEVLEVGRNTWYQHESFTPSQRPHMSKSIFNNHLFRKGRVIAPSV